MSVRTAGLSWQHRGSEPQEKAGMCWRLLTANVCLAPVHPRLLACLLTYQGPLLSAALKGRQRASAECPGGLPGGRAATLSEAGKAALFSMPPVHALQDSLACVMRATVVAMSVCCPSSACMPQAQGYIARPKPFHSAGTKGSLGSPCDIHRQCSFKQPHQADAPAMRSNRPAATLARTVSVLSTNRTCR